ALGLMLMQVAKLMGCDVVAVVKRDEQVGEAKRFGADDVVHINKTKSPIDAVIHLTEGRGSDVVIDAVGRPQVWQWAVDMVRRGGTVNFFGGFASGTKVELDTNRLKYSKLTLKSTIPHTPANARKAFALIAEKKIKSTDAVTGEAPLSKLKQVLQQMLERGNQIKTAIIPGH